MKISRYYQKYLRGSDLQGQVFTVTILKVTEAKVQPHPTIEPTVKLCLTVKGLPAELPDSILIGAKNASKLIEFFGDDTDKLPGKQIEIRPEAIKVAGVPKIAITIYPAGQARPGGNGRRPAGPPPAAPAPPPPSEIDEIPF